VIPTLLWQIERLARRHTLHVFALRQYFGARDYPLNGAMVHSLASASPPATWFSLDRAMRRHGPFDLVHAFWAGLPALLAGLWGRRHHRPVLVTLGGGELVACPAIGYGGQLRWTSRASIAASLGLASRLTVATRFMQDLVTPHGYRADLVPLGVPTDRFTPMPGERQHARLLHVGSINRVKDHHTLLRAFAIVARQIPDARLDLVGEDTLKGTIQREAATLGLTAMVHFAGWQPSSAMPAWYRRASAAIVSSRHESGPLVALEAAACGTPTVGTRVGHIADWSPDLATAVPIGDAEALAHAVLDLLRDDDRRARMASAARAFALRYDAEWTANEFDRLYQALS
jgi:glycosyltransferase involved in cell wall biosynthesis